MLNSDTRRNPNAMVAILAALVIVATFVAGRWTRIESAAANETGAAESAAIDAGPGMDFRFGEALMALEGKAQRGEGRAAGWYTCDVHKVGPGWNNTYLTLSSSSFSARWFRARETQEKEMLGAGLSALAAGKKIQVYVTGTEFSPYGEILACYVLE